MASDDTKHPQIMPKAINLMPTAAELVEKIKKSREVHWYAVRVSSQHERKIALMLKEAKFEVFVPLKKERHRWSDRIKVVEVVLTPGIIFVKNSMEKKNEVFRTRDVKSYVHAPGEKVPTPISDQCMLDFIRMVDSNYEVQMVMPSVGDEVMVLTGPLKGLVGTMVKRDGDNQLVVNLNDLFGAAVTIDPINVKKVPKGTCSERYDEISVR